MKYALLRGVVLISIFLAFFVGCVDADNAASSKKIIINDTMTSNASTVCPNESQMKIIGIIGGVSWVSSIDYYRLMNEMVNKECGDLHSAKILMYSIEESD